MKEIMRERPLVSAIIATYNRAHIVCEAIDSILHQSYPNIELIVVDDGSTDQTREKLNSYGTSIRVIYQKNSGPAAARNRGIRESRGEIVSFLDSDDLWLPTFVERQVSVLQRAGANVPCSLSNSWLGYADGTGTTSFQKYSLQPACDEGIWLNPAEILATRFVLFSQPVAVRRSAIERAGLFDESFRYLEDYDLALKLSVGKSWGFIREPLVVWRQSPTDSLSNTGLRESAKVSENAFRMRERILGKLDHSDESARLRKLLSREVMRYYEGLRVERLINKGRWDAELLAKSILFVHRCQNFLHSRSASYPHMESQQFDELSLNEQDPAVSLSGSPNS
jgi:glycosyltransferase involved in cell wall biosynthesis